MRRARASGWKSGRCARPGGGSTSNAARWAQLRREVDPNYSWPQAQARVNRAMGVRRRADAGEAELDTGLAFLRGELAKLARDYPEQAERLHIPGSVEGIDQRLGLATGEA